MVSAIRGKFGKPFIIALKPPGDDGVAGGIDLEMASAINTLLAVHAEDFDLWTSVWGAHARSLHLHLPDAHGPRHPYPEDIKALRSAHPGIAAGAIGYLTDPVERETALTNGTSDVVFLGRPLITDAAFPNKAAEGKIENIRCCVTCNSCWRSIIEAGALACDNNPKVGEPDEHFVAPPAVTSRRHVVIIGTGVAALEAAHTAAARGHKVTVLGDHDAIGGKTRLHAQMPGGENLSSVYDYQCLKAQQLGVKFELGRQARIEDVLSCDPDVVLLATGSRSARPGWLPEDWFAQGLIPSLRDMAKQLTQGMGRAPGRAIIVDQDHTEMTYATALRMATYFDQMTLVTSRERFANDVSLINRQGILKRLFESHVELICHVEPEGVTELEEGRFALRNVYNGALETLDSVTAVIHASSRVPNDGLREPLLAKELDIIPIGDCKAPRSLMAATREGYDIANAL